MLLLSGVDSSAYQGGSPYSSRITPKNGVDAYHHNGQLHQRQGYIRLLCALTELVMGIRRMFLGLSST